MQAVFGMEGETGEGAAVLDVLILKFPWDIQMEMSSISAVVLRYPRFHFLWFPLLGVNRSLKILNGKF